MGPPWNYQMPGVSFHQRIYRVTHIVLSTVGSEIGGTTYPGRIPGFFKFYAVPGHPTREEIAVQAQQGFLKAVAASPRQKTGRQRTMRPMAVSGSGMAIASRLPLFHRLSIHQN